MYDIKKSVPQHTYGDAREERMYRCYLFPTLAVDGMSGQHHIQATLYPWGMDPRYPMDRRLGGLQSQSRHRG
jgi:hypothetical protein